MYPLLDVKRDMYLLPNMIMYLCTYKFMSRIVLCKVVIYNYFMLPLIPCQIWL